MKKASFCLLTSVNKSRYIFGDKRFYSKMAENYLQLHTPVFSSELVPVKLYHDAKASKLDIIKLFKKNSIIYMWFNKVTGEVYRGTGWKGSNGLNTYSGPSVLNSTNKSLIYNSLLNDGKSNFTLAIL